MRTLLLLLLLVACKTEKPVESAVTVPEGDVDGDGFTVEEGDCNDESAVVGPQATEVCDGVDNDCDGTVDEEGVALYYADTDHDGFGDKGQSKPGCIAPEGFVGNALDCDDADSAIFPGASEACDGVDNDCDGAIDEDGTTPFFTDGDGDGYGDPTSVVLRCEAGAGFAANASDCNDDEPSIYPGAPEVCDGLDQDCDQSIDEDPTDGTLFYYDADQDGSGNCAVSLRACSLPASYTSSGCDCNDGDASLSPAAPEICDTLDNDCNGLIDEQDPNLSDPPSTYYQDSDADGYGDPNTPASACFQPPNTVTNNNDCNDGDASLSPAAPEICDTLDNDCDGLIDEQDPNLSDHLSTYYQDSDADGYGDPNTPASACFQPAGTVTNNNDCNDADASLSPAASEICDTLDNDCNGLIDEQDPNLSDPLSTYYQDSDTDGYGDPNTPASACFQPANTVTNNNDCNDADPTLSPAAPEICDALDNDCNGLIDEQDPNLLDPLSTYYQDSDADGYGDPNTPASACFQPPNTVANGDDCNDADARISPGATEIHDDTDQDCDGNPLLVGDGRDGDLVGSNTLALTTTTLATAAMVGDSSIYPDNLVGLVEGDIVMLWTESGTNAGVWGLYTITTVGGTNVDLYPPLQDDFSGGDFVIRVPQYHDVLLLSGETLSVSGSGILPLLADGTVSLAGTISLEGMGFSGGARQGNRSVAGNQGTSPSGAGTNGTAANGGGGGGGYSPSLTHADGGGGGHATAGTKGGASNIYGAVGGGGGGAYGVSDYSLLTMGSGGGGGGLDSDAEGGSYGGAGGAGGGVLLFITENLDFTGLMTASGANGENGHYAGSGASPGGGGGGAGGTLYVAANRILTNTGSLNGSGGKGGTGSEAGSGITTGGTGGDGKADFTTAVWSYSGLVW